MSEEVSQSKMDPEIGFHCFCEELLARIIGKFPDINVLLKSWRSQHDDVRNMFKKKEEEEDRYLETMILAWKEYQDNCFNF